jgi:hypothetical protein
LRDLVEEPLVDGRECVLVRAGHGGPLALDIALLVTLVASLALIPLVLTKEPGATRADSPTLVGTTIVLDELVPGKDLSDELVMLINM